MKKELVTILMGLVGVGVGQACATTVSSDPSDTPTNPTKGAGTTTTGCTSAASCAVVSSCNTTTMCSGGNFAACSIDGSVCSSADTSCAVCAPPDSSDSGEPGP